MDINKYDLNAPAFGKGSQKADGVSDEKPEAELKPEPADEKESAPEETSDEEPRKVAYSRFKKFHERATQAEKRLAELEDEARTWRERAESIKPQPVENTDLPAWWLKLYGDSDASKEAFKIQEEQNQSFKARLQEELREEALKAVREDSQREEARIKENVSHIDEQFEALAEFVGRELTEKEQSAILDVVDEFTPKDGGGNYLGAVLPFEKAWEIYELKIQASKAPARRSRDNVASLTGSSTEGDPAKDERAKNFDPLDWDAWRKRL